MNSIHRKPTYAGARVDTRAFKTLKSHVVQDHGEVPTLGGKKVAIQLFRHARVANPELFPKKSTRASLVDKLARIHEIEIGFGSRKQMPAGLDAVAKHGEVVLYRYSAAGPGISVPHPKEYAAHFVVNPKTRAISFYGNALPDSQMINLFKTVQGDVHAAYWAKVDEIEKHSGKFVPAQSVEYEPKLGRPIHVRTRVLRNVNVGKKGLELYSVDFESTLPEISATQIGSVLNRSLKTPSIIHTPILRNKISSFNDRYPNLE